VTVCFSGHRNIDKSVLPRLKAELESTIRKLISDGTDVFICGGALGFDMFAEQTILALQEEFPHIQLVLALPCPGHYRRWGAAEQEAMEEMIDAANKTVYVSSEYTRTCMFERNEYMVDSSDLLVCYLTEFKGGTVQTTNYAKRVGKKIVNVADGGTNG